MSNLTVLETEKTDRQKAEEFKNRITEAHKPILEILNEANKEGFQISIGCGPTPTGYQILQLAVVKHF